MSVLMKIDCQIWGYRFWAKTAKLWITREKLWITDSFWGEPYKTSLKYGYHTPHIWGVVGGLPALSSKDFGYVENRVDLSETIPGAAGDRLGFTMP